MSMQGLFEFGKDLPIEPTKVILIAVVFILSAVYLWSARESNFPRGPCGYPFVGNLKLLKSRPHLHLTNLKEKYGDVFSIKLGKYRAIVVSSFDGITDGLVRKSPKFSARPPIFSAHLLNGGHRDGGITFTDFGLEYKVKKDFLLKGLDRLYNERNDLEQMVASEVERIIIFLLALSGSFDPSYIIQTTFLRIMLCLINGKMYEPNDENFLEIVQTFDVRFHIHSCDQSVFVLLLDRLWQHKNMEAWKRFNIHFDYQRKIINRHKDCFNPSITDDLIDHMLVMLEGNEDLGLLDQTQLDILLVEASGSGYRALGHTLHWLLLYLASFPDVQEKVYEELVSVVGRDRLPRLSDQPFLPYTCAVVMETHRLATVMPFLYPHSAQEDTCLKGYEVPKGTIILFNIWSLHHDSRYWKQPMKFDPNRFLKEDGSLYIPDHFMPFAEGLRACPGESLADILLFLFTSHILHQLKLELTEKVDLDGLYKGYLLSPKPFQLNFVSREEPVSECQDVEMHDGKELQDSNDMVIAVAEYDISE